MGVLIAIVVFGLIIWGSWSFMTSGPYKSEPGKEPDLSAFGPSERDDESDPKPTV
jgi:hypothetical protein